VNGLGVAQTLSDQVKMSLRGCHAARRLLLESMEHVQDALEADRVDSAIRIALEIVANPKHAACDALQRLCVGRMLAELGLV
jgi:hypothetical protein